MSPLAITVALASACLAYVNGANDVSKGIATLAGSGVTNYRRAIAWGAVWTTAGSLAAFAFGGAMVATFGRGLLTPGTVPTLSPAIATLLGAGLWVGLATRFGLPVSTTHAIVGSIAGVISIAYGVAGVRWGIFGSKVVLPLLLSPVASLAISSTVLKAWKRLSPSSDADCLCAQIVAVPAAIAAGPNALEVETLLVPGVRVIGGRETECEINHRNTIALRLNHLHWLTSASVSFARGLNDAPKMVALLLGAAALLSSRALGSSFLAYLIVAFGILSGSLSAGWRVTTVLAEKITPMNHQEGFIANLITSVLVGPGAILGLPMSTTHVASGAIIGVGLQQNGQIDWHTVRSMLLAWMVTVPGAALFGILTYAVLRTARIA